MNRTQFFTDALAAMLASELAAAGIDLLVRGAVTPPSRHGDRLDVVVTGVDDLIPGNYTVKITGLLLLHVAEVVDAVKVERRVAEVGDVVRGVLCSNWRHRPLPHPVPGSDPEYDAEPFLVLDLVAAPQHIDVAANGYQAQQEFRAYVQF